MTLEDFKKWLKGFSLGVLTCPDESYYDMKDVLHTIISKLDTIKEGCADPCDCSKCVDRVMEDFYQASKQFCQDDEAQRGIARKKLSEFSESDKKLLQLHRDFVSWIREQPIVTPIGEIPVPDGYKFFGEEENKMTLWTNVSDGLPKDYMPYLCRLRMTDQSDGAGWYQVLYYDFKRREDWSYKEQWCYSDPSTCLKGAQNYLSVLHEVTHWMPIPVDSKE
jgi:hypothetical protein